MAVDGLSPEAVRRLAGREPGPGEWERVLSVRTEGERGAVAIVFPEPLDQALLARMLTVVDSAGGHVDGTVEVSLAETRWSFRPEEACADGEHRVRVDAQLEDLAGNRIGRVFDSPSSEPPSADTPFEPVLEIPFVPGAC